MGPPSGPGLLARLRAEAEYFSLRTMVEQIDELAKRGQCEQAERDGHLQRIKDSLQQILEKMPGGEEHLALTDAVVDVGNKTWNEDALEGSLANFISEELRDLKQILRRGCGCHWRAWRRRRERGGRRFVARWVRLLPPPRLRCAALLHHCIGRLARVRAPANLRCSFEDRPRPVAKALLDV